MFTIEIKKSKPFRHIAVVTHLKNSMLRAIKLFITEV